MQSPTGTRDAWSNYVVIVLLVAAAAYTTSLWLAYSEIEVWRHDAAYYLNSYTLKLKSEGRWINYYLFDLLKSINPFISAALHLAFLALFLTCAAYRVCRDSAYACITTLVCIASATIYIQLLWPVTTLPSFTFLALAALCYRQLPAILYFPIFGILFFGSMSHLYFLLPLLFIADYLDKDVSFRRQARRFILQLLIPWTAGYIVGYLVATGAVYVETGQAAIMLADWREPQPVSDTASLIANISRAADYLAQDTLAYLHMLGWFSAPVLVLACVSYAARRQLFQLFIPLVVMLGLYASTIPYGISLSFRTSMGIWFGLVFIFLVIPNIGLRERVIYSATAVTVLIFTVPYSLANLNWYRQTTSYYLEELNAVTESKPQDHIGLLFLSDSRKYPQVEQEINEHLQLPPTIGILTMGTAPRWIAIAKQAGFSTVKLCIGRSEMPLCREADVALARASRISPGGLYHSGTTDSGWLVVKLNNGFSAQ